MELHGKQKKSRINWEHGDHEREETEGEREERRIAEKNTQLNKNNRKNSYCILAPARDLSTVLEMNGGSKQPCFVPALL